MPHKTIAGLTAGKLLFLLDAALLACAWPLALVLAGAPTPWHAPYWFAVALCPAFYVLVAYALGLYRRDVIVEPRKSFGRVPVVAAMGVLAAAAAAALVCWWLGLERPEASLFAAAFLCSCASATAARAAFYALRDRGVFHRRLLVVGAGRRAWDLAWMLRKEGATLNDRIVFVHDPVLGEIDPRLADESAGPVVHAPVHGILDIARHHGVDQIVVAPDERRGLALDSLLACKVAGFPVTQYLSFVEREIHRVDLKRMELSWLLYSEGFHFGLMDRALKRGLDLLVSGVTLAFSAPFLLAAMAAIKLDDGGPVLYRQERVTKDGRGFYILKLRTMRVDAEAGGAVWAASNDARITRIGVFLRRTRLDELPQLFNVLRGDMSLVGPRPERPAFVEMLSGQLSLYRERHVVKAGLTGWAQVNYPYGASTDDARSKLSYDLYYVKNFSVLFDLLIILQTIRVVLWPGAAGAR